MKLQGNSSMFPRRSFSELASSAERDGSIISILKKSSTIITYKVGNGKVLKIEQLQSTSLRMAKNGQILPKSWKIIGPNIWLRIDLRP
jgi:hypothetical protein